MKIEVIGKMARKNLWITSYLSIILLGLMLITACQTTVAVATKKAPGEGTILTTEKEPPEPDYRNPVDTDGDGIYDHLDKCPGTPPGEKIDCCGCLVDDDGDGVENVYDQCPDTPRGAKVDEFGCSDPIKEHVTFVIRIEFDFDRADIKPEHHEQIGRLAQFMEQHPQTKAVLEGHTDSIGSPEYNQGLFPAEGRKASGDT